MGVGTKLLSENLQRVRDEMASAAVRARRSPESVTLVAVTKSADDEDIRNLVEQGVADLGESRAQQLVARSADLAAWLARRRKDTPEVRWHMIGHLQRNKVKQVLEAAEIIHSVDTLRLAEEINVRAGQAGKVVRLLLEVNCSEEPQKSGAAVGAAAHLGEQIVTLGNVSLIGLMTMAPVVSDPQRARPTFVRLREIFEEMRRDKIGGKDFQHLSMGMSQDYAVAIEEGATMVRVGTALFRP